MPLANNQVLKYNGTKWTNALVNLSELNDVTLTSPTSNQVLSYNGTKWVNSPPSSSGAMITDTTTTSLNLSSYSTNSFVDYRANSITVTNGPSNVNGTVVGGLVVEFQTDGGFL